MKSKDWQKLLDRDGGCVHCGEFVAVAPNHRINRGMGGSKLLDFPENLVVLCSSLNGLIESDSRWAAVALEFGWKLRSWDDARSAKFFNAILGEWVLPDGNWGYSDFS